MRRGFLAIGLAAAAGLGGCVSYHQEVAALRMPRPSAHSAELSAYAPPDRDYPSVGGDILRGTSPRAASAYEATSGDAAPPAPDVGAH